ncbi:MAG TPA: septum formation initiator family protein [Candidatus Dormibacteraeota bacterium]|nr:septum formation initiator family protein [Candidatus Dormibacteraeota bacterium]
MQTKSHYKQTVLAIVNRLNDIRFVGQMLFLIIVLLVSWSGVKVIQANYGLQKQISVLKQQNKVQQLQNENLALQNQYYNSNQYLGLSARENFGLAAPGEKEIIVPRQVALNYTVNLPSISTTTVVPKAYQPAYQSNFESWVNFFLHRQSNNN